MGGLIVDTSVFIHLERQGVSPDFARWREYGDVFISAITLSEMLVGIHRANTIDRRVKRQAFIDAVRSRIAVLPFDEIVAITHAQLAASLADAGTPIGAHDLLIAATAITNDCALLTANSREFSRVTGLDVLPF